MRRYFAVFSLGAILCVSAAAWASPGGGSRGAFFGVRTESERGGLAVREVAPGSPAESAGVVVGDVILDIDGTGIRNPNELIQFVAASSPGRVVHVRLRNGSATRVVNATLVAPTGALQAGSSGGVNVGQAAPEIVGTRVSGPDNATLSALRGRVVLVDFWATWCGPCAMIMPELDSLHHASHDRGLTVLGVTDQSESTVRSHFTRNHLNYAYTIASDGGRSRGAYGIRALPTLVLIDRRGVVRDVQSGFDSSTMPRLRAQIDLLLAEPAP